MSDPVAAGGAEPAGIDPRSPRFGAGISAVLLLVVVLLGLLGPRPTTPTGVAAVTLLAAVSALFAWGAVAGIRRHPYGALFRRLIRPRLGPPTELEAPAPPTFAQGVGFAVTVVGLALALVGVPFAAAVGAALAFVAAFLNSAFGVCLGCILYLWLLRLGLVRRAAANS